jgi:hypothetical protein
VSDFNPGIHLGMSDETYHGDPVPGGSLSSTFARLLTDNVPAKAVELRKRPPTAAMTLGKAAHAHALGTGPTLHVWQYDGRTKDGKAERAALADEIAADRIVAVTEAERDRILGMASTLRSEPFVMGILERARAEVSVFWCENDVWCRARVDLLEDADAWDYKTTLDATARGFSKSLGNYGYHQQADFYRRGLRAVDHPAGERPFRFIVQESTPPYLIQVHEPDAEAMDFARVLNDKAIATYAECKAADKWPGFAGLVNEPTPLPPFYFHDHDDLIVQPELTL